MLENTIVTAPEMLVATEKPAGELWTLISGCNEVMKLSQLFKFRVHVSHLTFVLICH